MKSRGLAHTIFYIMWFLMLVTFCEGILQLKLAYFADEVLLSISTLVVFINVSHFYRSKIGKRLVFWFIAYFIIQVVNFITSPYHLQLIYTFGQALINLKVIIIPLAFFLLIQKLNIKKIVITRFLYLFVILFFLGLVLNIILQAEWNLMLGWKVEYRYGFLRLAGWFGGTHYLGYFFTLVSLVIWMSYLLRRRNQLTWKFYWLYSTVQIIISFPLTIRKGLVSIFSLIYYSMISGSSKKVIRTVMVVVGMSLLGYLLVGDSSYIKDTKLDVLQMTNNDDDNYYIRGLMVYNGASLAISHFPFGTGAGTFGTVLSKYNTLEVYQKVNIPSFWYESEDLSGVYDSGFFSLLAENGIFGIIVMVFIVIYFFQILAERLTLNGSRILQVLIVTMAIWSITEPVVQNGIFTVIFSSLCMYILKVHRDDNKVMSE